MVLAALNRQIQLLRLLGQVVVDRTSGRTGPEFGGSFLQTSGAPDPKPVASEPVSGPELQQTVAEPPPERPGHKHPLDDVSTAMLLGRLMPLITGISSGSKGAAEAIAGLMNLAGNPTARFIMNMLQVSELLRLVMQKDKTPDFVRNAAGSLIAKITGHPSWSNLPDMATGGHAHVNIVMPRPSDTYASDEKW